MPAIPRETALDSSRALLSDPYRFIARRCRHHEADLFEARIMFRPTICMSGAAAAELFYDRERFERAGGAPEPLRATLFGKGAVQSLDGAQHRRRKALFLQTTRPERVARLADLADAEWQRSARIWSAGGPLALYAAVQAPLTRAVCAWAGVPLAADDVEARTHELVALFDAAAAAGFGHLRARLARRDLERWLAGFISSLRAGRIEAAPESAASAIAWHLDAGDALLPPRIAAVELINLLRPTIAVSVFIVFTAHALHRYPEALQALLDGEPGYAEHFVEEVRRWYPFFPAVAARVRQDFEWQGYPFPRGRRVLLDLYGTNHDPRAWDAPELFKPERFRERPPTPFNFIPQGGARADDNHRCPGEGIAKTLMLRAVDFLVRRLRYDVPAQNLDLDYGRLPALPYDRFVIRDVRLVT